MNLSSALCLSGIPHTSLCYTNGISRKATARGFETKQFQVPEKSSFLGSLPVHRTLGVARAPVSRRYRVTSMTLAAAHSDAPTHVAIIGGGLAGLSAAIQASMVGPNVKVTLLDKCAKIGGNSAKASSGMSAVEDQEKEARAFLQDTISSGGGLSDKALVQQLVGLSTEALEFLRSMGPDMAQVVLTGGHSAPRTRRPGPDKATGAMLPVGVALISNLSKYLTQNVPNAQIITKARVTKLLSEPVDPLHIKVTGLEYVNEEDGSVHTLHTDSVVLTTGGYGRDRELLTEFVGPMCLFPTTNGEQTTGDGVKLARAIGAQLKQMEQVQVHPTGFVPLAAVLEHAKDGTLTRSTWAGRQVFLAPEMLRGAGGILVDRSGARFVDELAKREVVSNAIIRHCQEEDAVLQDPTCEVTAEQVPLPVSFLVMNDEVMKKVGAGVFKFYESQGLLKRVNNASELCKYLGLYEEVFLNTLAEYADSCDKSVAVQVAAGTLDPEFVAEASDLDVHCEGMGGVKLKLPAARWIDVFGKSWFPTKLRPEEPFWVAAVTPSVHYTMGGLAINTSTEVMQPPTKASKDGKPHRIQGLFAAGEVTGGLHGQNRLAGNSLLDCVVYGRIAGQRAAMINAKPATEPGVPKDAFVELRCCQHDVRTPSEFVLRFELPSQRQVSGEGQGGARDTSCHYHLLAFPLDRFQKVSRNFFLVLLSPCSRHPQWGGKWG
eukprot:jgi/Mesvir1/18913/Mv18902-RA.3